MNVYASLRALLVPLFQGNWSSMQSETHTARPSLEMLDQRLVPAGSFVLSTSGLLTIKGTAANDVVEVHLDLHGTASTADDEVVATMTHSGHTDSARFPQTEVSRVAFFGYAGNDSFRNNLTLSCTADGGAGNDLLAGNVGNDVLKGGGGSDLIYGRAGDDTLEGQSGNDWLFAAEGHDKLFGGGGLDHLFGEAGNDFLDGGNDGFKDVMRGGSGMDTYRRHMNMDWFGPIALGWITELEDIDYHPAEGDQIVYERHWF